MENFQQAGSLLDASARIYSFRVDATHSEAYDVRSKLGDSKLALIKLLLSRSLLLKYDFSESQSDNSKCDKKDSSTHGDDDDEEGISDKEGKTDKKVSRVFFFTLNM